MRLKILASRVPFAMHRVFILSPANSSGERANLIYNPRARFDLARRLQKGQRAPLGEIFSFLSGLYFRGKFTYAAFFGRPPGNLHPAYVITSNRGLIPATEPMSLEELRAFAEVPIDPAEGRYARPLASTARRLSAAAGADCEFVLLGSIGTKKYAELLLEHFAERLLFPSSFVGRGDMSRGGLLLRSVAENQELEYVPVTGSIRHGKRPGKLPPRSWGYKISEGSTPVPKGTARTAGTPSEGHCPGGALDN
jgi:hypothetical protein